MANAQAGESKKRSMVKTISWRAVASLDTFLIGLFVIYVMDQNGAAAAAWISGLEIPNKILLFYFHERVWSKIKYGIPKPIDYQI